MPPSNKLLAFTVASVVLTLIPGPSLLFTIGRAISAGRRDALLTVLGNVSGIFTQVLLVAAGLGPLIAASDLAFAALTVGGAAYLIWLGIDTIRHRGAVVTGPVGADAVVTPTFHALRKGYAVGVTNAKTIVFFAALLPQFVEQSRGRVWLQMVVLGLVFAVVAVLSDGSVALIAGKARDWFARTPHRIAHLQAVGGVMMILLGSTLLFAARR